MIVIAPDTITLTVYISCLVLPCLVFKYAYLHIFYVTINITQTHRFHIFYGAFVLRKPTKSALKRYQKLDWSNLTIKQNHSHMCLFSSCQQQPPLLFSIAYWGMPYLHLAWHWYHIPVMLQLENKAFYSQTVVKQ